MTNMEDAKKDSLKFFNGDELAADAFLKKYALRSKDNKKLLEKTPADMWERMARTAASVEKDKNLWEKKFYEAFTGFKAVPQGSIMFALGNKEQKSSCSNCFVFDVEDSLESIGATTTEMMRTYSYRGGCGLDISKLRPDNTGVNNAAIVSSGAASFMEHFSNITRMIGINGRRGALMLTIGIDHPDVELFTRMKHDLTKVTGANVSIRITDDFMKAVENDKKWVATFTTSYQVSNPQTITKEWRARDLWKIIVESATRNAEPGILFWDNIIKNSPSDCYADLGYGTICTNPCSELPLENYGACTLLSMNLAKYTHNDFLKESFFDEKSFFEDVYVATRFLDNVKTIDSEMMPLPQQREHAIKSRRIGMGIHGLADAMANLQIKYDSDKGVNFIDKLFEKYTKAVYGASVELAKEKGPFPLFDAKREKGHPFLERIGFAGKPRRNIACMTLAPTGTVSLISQSSSGIEPVFRNSYTRRVKISHNMEVSADETKKIFVDALGDKWLEYDVYHHNADRFLKINPNEKELPDYFVTSDQIDWKKRVEIQGVITKWLDHSCSSTVNLPKGTTSDTVGKIYMEAWKKGCKGMTVYVDGSRSGVLITEEDKKEDKSSKKSWDRQAIERPAKVPCDIYRIVADGDKYVVMVGFVNGKPYEVFCGKPKKIDIGKVEKGYIEKESRGRYSLHIGEDMILRDISDIFDHIQGSITRLISTLLRHDVDIHFIVQQLEKSDGDIVSFNKAIARVLKKYIHDGVKEAGEKCSSCNQESLIREEGCIKCSSCGWTKC